MVVGLFGHPGAHVLSHAEKENGSENEHVIVQNHCLVGTIVKVPIPTNRHVNCRWFVQASTTTNLLIIKLFLLK